MEPNGDSARAEQRGRCGLVLVVEDDRDIRQTIAEVLEDEGHAVATAEHGADALDVLRRSGAKKPCLILLDLMMPVMNGWELRDELRKDEQMASIPIIVLSGDAHLDEKAASFGAAGAVAKPVSLARLLEIVERFC